ncbi:hypothetical protein CDEST_15623 [Colletotrichum destructivum]|uniref:Uncharacterized protein n=1 Tax=Colletotrichum destructivum TaxID=34406 RepID=A0AAX4J4U5_9PEZI|nr:hypothetical protein CDEST_15623 [Colletotrichum destructivum]
MPPMSACELIQFPAPLPSGFASEQQFRVGVHTRRHDGTEMYPM